MKRFATTTLFLFLSAMASMKSTEALAHEAFLSLDEILEDDAELSDSQIDFQMMACRAATTRQIATIDEGNKKKSDFLSQCARETQNSPWCQQLIRPNPSSKNTFQCTYGAKQVHQLIHPDEKTWPFAYQAVRLVESLQQKGIQVCQIYNWWRPEPYNANVGGAAGRHPYGTSVDVRFCSKNDQEKAHILLCEWRKQGHLRALGYYSGTALHFGIGDALANTWGKSCR